jgi:small-conductance mechanosensitive channel
MEDTELKIGGFTFKGWYIAAALPILSGISGAIYFGYDTLQRFYAVEAGIEQVLQASETFDETSIALASRIQALEQAVQDNDVRGLNTRLSQISTNMQTILEQQRTLLDLRSQVERSTTITDGIGDKLDTFSTEIDDIWKAYDSLVANPL